jgi:hypothetical protein
MNKMHGHGIYTYPDGSEIEGEWEMGEPLEQEESPE